jgi:hypothetical protein
MGTLDEIQQLQDGEFHLLGDALLRRLDPRYRLLRTHGLNDRGESIKGQPDSYVGDTAATCRVAVCYTVQREGWWNKVVADVREAVAASPMVEEVVVVLPHNVDRAGPKDKSIDWLSSARAAAGNAKLRVIDGRDISRRLDSDDQDLRHDYLGIPYSRLSGPSILAGCQRASLKVIDSITASGRYDPERYVQRTADGELYRLWQAATRQGVGDDSENSPIRLIALVNDSGVGKTSLVCEFTRRLGMVLPVLLVEARDLQFGTEDSLVAFVIQAIQGVLDPIARVIEEAALCKHLNGSVVLTVVLDGLDEAHEPEAVRRAITQWLRSNLGQSSILIVTSRREFWRTCVDPRWARWMPPSAPEDRSPVSVAERTHIERTDPVVGIKVPDRFSEDEFEAAWLRAGLPRQELLTFPDEVRLELRHPFTLRVFLDLRSQGAPLPRTLTRAAILESWLNRRLDAEELPGERITRSQFQQALRVVASGVAETNSGSVSVDELPGVPRFDPAHPPGPVIQRLIGANILETVPSQSDRVRFSIEAVQDFYRAEADIEEIKNDPRRMAETYSCLTFTAASPRLERIGYGSLDERVRDEFARHMAELNARMAAVLLSVAPDQFSSDTRAMIADALGRQIPERHHVRAAMAISLLADMDCQESAEVLASYFLLPSEIPRHLTSLGATAFSKLGYLPAAQFVYRWHWFGLVSNTETYYFKELLGIFRGTNADFRNALAEQALQQISYPSGTQGHAKAVSVLAHLGDRRLLANLETRLAENGLLASYENHALIALGTDSAGALFAQSVMAVGGKLTGLPDDQANHDARRRIIDLVHFTTRDIRYLLTSAFEPHLRRLIEDASQDVSWIASDLAQRGLVASLLYPAAVAANRRHRTESEHRDQRVCVSTDLWLGWWSQSTDLQVRRRILRLLPLNPSPEVEKILIECLDSPDLCGCAAKALGDYGVVRSAARLREILANGITAGDSWSKSSAAHALGNLLDEAAVPVLEETAATHPDEHVIQEAVSSLGVIGSPETEHALERLLQCGKGQEFEDMVLDALLLCGSRSAVATVVSRAKSRQDGPHWLCERLARIEGTRGWRRGEYYTHIHTDELVDYLATNYHVGSPEQAWELGEAFRQIDSPAVRGLLRKWTELRGSAQDLVIRENGRRRLSDICFEELRDRGDESAIEYTLDERRDNDDHVYILVTADFLRPFPATVVAERLRLRLAAATTPSETVRMLALLGRFGETIDAELASRFQDHSDDLVANVACEAMLRLSDPMLVPEHWRAI